MTTATAVLTKTAKVEVSSSVYFNCYITLSELEQKTIEIEDFEYVYSNGTSTLNPTGVKRKVRLEKLIYGKDNWNNDSQVKLESIVVRGYRKDGAIRFRDEHLRYITKEVLEQIPDSYHDYARQAFDKHSKELQAHITEMINNGLEIKPTH